MLFQLAANDSFIDALELKACTHPLLPPVLLLLLLVGSAGPEVRQNLAQLLDHDVVAGERRLQRLEGEESAMKSKV